MSKFLEQMATSDALFKQHKQNAEQLIERKAYEAAIVEITSAIKALQEYYTAWRAQKSQEGYWFVSFRSSDQTERNLVRMQIMLGDCYQNMGDLATAYKSYRTVGNAYEFSDELNQKLAKCKHQMLQMAIQYISHITRHETEKNIIYYQWQLIRGGVIKIARDLLSDVNSSISHANSESRIQSISRVKSIFDAYKDHLDADESLTLELLESKLQTLTEQSDVPIARVANTRARL